MYFLFLENKGVYQRRISSSSVISALGKNTSSIIIKKTIHITTFILLYYLVKTQKTDIIYQFFMFSKDKNINSLFQVFSSNFLEIGFCHQGLQ